jgi:guanylate kinase
MRARGIDTTTVFVMPPSMAVLEQRLRGRSKDSETEIQRRLQVARDEVAAFAEYDFVVVNDELTSAVDRLRSIVVAERSRLDRMQPSAERIVSSFSKGAHTP